MPDVFQFLVDCNLTRHNSDANASSLVIIYRSICGFLYHTTLKKTSYDARNTYIKTQPPHGTGLTTFVASSMEQRTGGFATTAVVSWRLRNRTALTSKFFANCWWWVAAQTSRSSLSIAKVGSQLCSNNNLLMNQTTSQGLDSRELKGGFRSVRLFGRWLSRTLLAGQCSVRRCLCCAGKL